ncbi:hypothetical protein [Winogradskyella thalassocola]|uniref:Uncharacterized protein n=1 Tax=Winogradskyella thalassocola TaxID=262004 RepID=A0A1G8H3W5_9FLAO|nr:hypothetical protein [Winogradskyella thalassocola]SDI01334.1 hypothetical protein SAMN04489796_106122 [Winogradskyella thalassocola]
MKRILIMTVALTCFSGLLAQQKETNSKSDSGLRMETEYASDIEEVSDLLSFEGIDYMKLKFSGEQLKGKSYRLSVKEIWDGKIVSDTVIINSKTIGYKQFETLSDTVFKMKVISKRTNDNQLKMTFKFPRFSITKKYDAIDSDNYSLRNLVDESNLEIGYDKSFYLLAYILPYEREDGSLSWCDVGTSGNDIENWGEKFGIKHYLLFEMKFE